MEFSPILLGRLSPKSRHAFWQERMFWDHSKDSQGYLVLGTAMATPTQVIFVFVSWNMLSWKLCFGSLPSWNNQPGHSLTVLDCLHQILLESFIFPSYLALVGVPIFVSSVHKIYFQNALWFVNALLCQLQPILFMFLPKESLFIVTRACSSFLHNIWWTVKGCMFTAIHARCCWRSLEVGLWLLMMFHTSNFTLSFGNRLWSATSAFEFHCITLLPFSTMFQAVDIGIFNWEDSFL